MGANYAHRHPLYVYTHVHDKSRLGLVVDRASGGKATLVPETGGYRPLVTHHTTCPKCGQWRNVAILNAPYDGVKRVVCEVCDWTWLHRAVDAPNPLIKGTNGSFRREMLGAYPGQRQVYAERGN